VNIANDSLVVFESLDDVSECGSFHAVWRAIARHAFRLSDEFKIDDFLCWCRSERRHILCRFAGGSATAKRGGPRSKREADNQLQDAHSGEGSSRYSFVLRKKMSHRGNDIIPKKTIGNLLIVCSGDED
jgi:hypothetical protein